MRNSVLLVGHVTYDEFGGQLRKGGPPMYQGPVLSKLGCKVEIITSSSSEYNFPDQVKVYNLPAEVTTTFKFYFGKKPGNQRQLQLISRANTLHLEEIKRRITKQYDLVIISPVINEVPISVVKYLQSISKNILVDIQGFIRQVDQNNRIYHIPPNPIINDLEPYVDSIKISNDEMTKLDFETFSKELIITGSGNFIRCITKNENINISTTPVSSPKDDTGSGDIFIAAYGYYRQYLSIRDALLRADKETRPYLQQIGIPEF